MRDGKDPIEERELLRKKQPTGINFQDAASAFIEAKSPGWKNKKHQAQWINTLRTYVFPTMGHKLLSEIDVNDIAEALRPIWLTKVETASRVKQRIHHVLEWACAQQIIVGNPVNGVKHLLPKQPSTSVRV